MAELGTFCSIDNDNEMVIIRRAQPIVICFSIQATMGKTDAPERYITRENPRVIDMIEFQVAKEPDEIAKLVAHSAQLNMVSVKCFCSNNYAKYISCFVDVGHNNAPFLAKALGGYVLDNPRVSGHATVSFSLAIPPDFCCSHRDDNQNINNGKCFCHCSYSRVNPRFLR